jgi:ribosome biogenesis GTPase
MIDMELLGWDAGRQKELDDLGDPRLVQGRITVQHRGAYDVLTPDGVCRCEVVPRMVRDAATRADFPAVGDWVALEPQGAGHGAIGRLLARRTRFSRLAAHDAASDVTEEQIVAANVDVVFVVTSLNEDFNPRRIERYLTLAWQSGARPVILLTKSDLVDDPAAALVAVADVAIGVPVHVLSTLRGSGLDAVTGELGRGVTAALLGSSGVGKSTLVNALVGDLRMATKEIRADGKGRHTTTRRELIMLPGDTGILIDTPGMRELQLWVADDGLEEAFDDVASLLPSCRFADCGHESEPGCAVKEALACGRLAPERWESYLKLQRELEALERRIDKRVASEARQQWRSLSKAQRAYYKEHGKDR